jgi:hypothetical protein
VNAPAVPPGWPPEVHPPGTEGFERTAVAYLLDQCPPGYRSYPVLRRQPVVLARFAVHHVDGAVAGAREGYRRARAELRDAVAPEVVGEALEVWETEGARLVSVARAVDLVEQALRGKRFVPRL